LGEEGVSAGGEETKERGGRTFDLSVAVPEHGGIFLDLLNSLGRNLGVNELELVAMEMRSVSTVSTEARWERERERRRTDRTSPYP
jgi:hypothetical protein